MELRILLLFLFVGVVYGQQPSWQQQQQQEQQDVDPNRYVIRLKPVIPRRVIRDQSSSSPSSSWFDYYLGDQETPAGQRGGPTKLRQLFIRPRNLQRLRATYRKPTRTEPDEEESPQTPDPTTPSTGSNPNQLTASECQEVWTVARNYGISDISGYARDNCLLLQLYFPDSTCEEIFQAVHSCTV